MTIIERTKQGFEFMNGDTLCKCGLCEEGELWIYTKKDDGQWHPSYFVESEGEILDAWNKRVKEKPRQILTTHWRVTADQSLTPVAMNRIWTHSCNMFPHILSMDISFYTSNSLEFTIQIVDGGQEEINQLFHLLKII